MSRRIFVDMDGTLAEWKNVSKIDELYEEGYYYNLEPNKKLIENLKKMIQKGEEIYILSSFLNDSKYALVEKNRWLDSHLPELKNENRIFVKYGDDKSRYIKGGISDTDYLLDDYTKNLLEWKASGGVGIKYLNGINHTKGTWQGLMLDSNKLDNSLEKVINNYEANKDLFNKKYLDLYKKLEDNISKIGEEYNFDFNEFSDIREETIKERDRLLRDYDIEIESTWKDESSEDLVVHYKIRNNESKLLYDGYTTLNYIENIDEDSIRIKILANNFHNKIDITSVSKELKCFVDYVLTSETDGYIRVYEDDLLNYFDINGEELIKRIDNIKNEIKNLGIVDCLDINYSNFNNKINYVDISPDIIYEFEFSNASNEKNISKTLNYNINGKDIICELKYNNKLHGFAVTGYTVDNENINQDKVGNVLSKEELSKIQGLLLNEINEIYTKEFFNNSYEEKDITDDMF